MNAFTMTINFLLALFASLMLVGAAPVALDARDVWDPPVLYPSAGTVWKAGNHHNVTWNTTNPPKEITNGRGMVILAKSGLQDYEHPLATNFSILLGRIEVQVPKNATPGDDYQIVLFGDSGNYGPTFTIEA